MCNIHEKRLTFCECWVLFLYLFFIWFYLVIYVLYIIIIEKKKKNCHIEWFHYYCVKISRVPRGKWYCNKCLGKEKVLILHLVNYFVSFSVLIYKTQVSLKYFVFFSIFSKWQWKDHSDKFHLKLPGKLTLRQLRLNTFL